MPIIAAAIPYFRTQAGMIFRFRSKLGDPWQFVFHQFHVIYDRMCLKHDATKLSLQFSTLLKLLRFIKNRT